MKNLLLGICLLMVSVPAMANSVNCVGMDNAGQKVTISANSDSADIKINGFKHTIVGKTKSQQGFVTETYLNGDGVLIYDSLLPLDTTMMIFQFDAVSQELMATANLNCEISS